MSDRPTEESGISPFFLLCVSLSILLLLIGTTVWVQLRIAAREPAELQLLDTLLESSEPGEVTTNEFSVVVEVAADGSVYHEGDEILLPELQGILEDMDPATTELVLYGDARVSHEAIRAVMETATKSGIWRIKFAAVRQPSAEVGSP